MLFKKKEIDLNCPRCNILMRKIEKHKVIIDVCPKCNGLWLDDKEIDKLVKMGGKRGKK